MHSIYSALSPPPPTRRSIKRPRSIPVNAHERRPPHHEDVGEDQPSNTQENPYSPTSPTTKIPQILRFYKIVSSYYTSTKTPILRKRPELPSYTQILRMKSKNTNKRQPHLVRTCKGKKLEAYQISEAHTHTKSPFQIKPQRCTTTYASMVVIHSALHHFPAVSGGGRNSNAAVIVCVAPIKLAPTML